MHTNTHYSVSAREDQPTPRRNKNPGLRSALSTLAVIASAVFVAILIVSFVFRPYIVDGPSMEPTLHNGDRLIIWKLPHTWGKITGNSYVPNRGDVIVFTEHGLLSNSGLVDEQLIKRVIAVPGDRIVIEDGTTTVFNTEHPNGFQPDTTMPYGEGLSLAVDKNEAIDITVEDDEVFVMGDNRNNSRDSRMFGTVDVDQIVGKLTLRIFPLNKAQSF